MNASLHNILTRASVREPHAPVVRRQAGNAINFRNVLQSSNVDANSAATPAPAPAAPSSLLTPAVVASITPINVAATGASGGPLPNPPSQQALLNQPWDPFNRAQHEATMNNWYVNAIQRSNQQKLQIYEHGVADWKVNAAHCRDLGIQAPPPPVPPVLEAVGPMPDGYWFGTHS